MRKANENHLSFFGVGLLTLFPLFYVFFVSILFRFTFYTQEKYKSSVVRNYNSLILQPERGEQPKTYVMRLQKAIHYYV